MQRWILALGLLAGLAASPALAENGVAPGAPGGMTPPETAPAAKNSDFEKTQRLEALRYRHMWIAFGGMWLLVFGFAFRTWRRAEQTESELETLKRRLTELESKHG